MTISRRALAVLGLPALLCLSLLIALLLRRPNAAESGGPRGARTSAPEEIAAKSSETRSPVAEDIGGKPGSEVSSLDSIQRVFQIRTREGRPARAKVRIAFSKDGFAHFETLDVEADASGQVRLNLDPRSWVAVSVQSPGFAPRWRPPVAWGDLQDRDLTFALDVSTPVDGTSRWIDGRPMSNVRLSFAPVFPPGEFSGMVASRLKIVDEELTTDADGRFRCASLRAENYRVSFPDHPKWPALQLSADLLRSGSLDLKAYWSEPSRK